MGREKQMIQWMWEDMIKKACGKSRFTVLKSEYFEVGSPMNGSQMSSFYYKHASIRVTNNSRVSNGP